MYRDMTRLKEAVLPQSVSRTIYPPPRPLAPSPRSPTPLHPTPSATQKGEPNPSTNEIFWDPMGLSTDRSASEETFKRRSCGVYCGIFFPGSHLSKRMSSSSVAIRLETSPKFPATAPGNGARLPYRSTCSPAGSDLSSERPLTQKACNVPGTSPRTVVVVMLPTVIWRFQCSVCRQVGQKETGGRGAV